MTKFNWFKAVGFGALIWAIMFGLASAIIAFITTINISWSIALAIAVGVVSYMFAYNAKPENTGQALGYGAIFAAVGIVLDLIISQQFVSGLFGMWTYYVGYALILFAPLLELGSRGSTNATVFR